MTVSVRMEASLESDIEKTAKLRGITKSQFIIEAVERALGRKNPYQLLMKIRSPNDANYAVSKEQQAQYERPLSDRFKDKLLTQQSDRNAEWLAYQSEKKAPVAAA